MKALLLALTLAGCHDDLTGTPELDLSVADRALDLTAPTRPDFAGADLELAGFCAGTLVAGTCVQTFFAPLSLCFAPSGSCVAQTPIVASTPTWCWSSGAELKQMQDLSALHRWYQFNTNVCFTEIIGGAGPSPAFTAGGQPFVFAPATGNYTCPDGSKGNIGTNFGGCAQLQAMLSPDTSSCTQGTCP